MRKIRDWTQVSVVFRRFPHCLSLLPVMVVFCWADIVLNSVVASLFSLKLRCVLLYLVFCSFYFPLSLSLFLLSHVFDLVCLSIIFLSSFSSALTISSNRTRHCFGSVKWIELLPIGFPALSNSGYFNRFASGQTGHQGKSQQKRLRELLFNDTTFFRHIFCCFPVNFIYFVAVQIFVCCCPTNRKRPCRFERSGDRRANKA